MLWRPPRRPHIMPRILPPALVLALTAALSVATAAAAAPRGTPGHALPARSTLATRLAPVHHELRRSLHGRHQAPPHHRAGAAPIASRAHSLKSSTVRRTYESPRSRPRRARERRPSEPRNLARNSPRIRRGRRGATSEREEAEISPARSVPVVSVIRPTAARPQLPSISDAVEQPLVLPAVTEGAHGRLVIPPPLRGSREILLHQNQVASDDGLGRVQDDADLEAMRHRGMLVAVPEDAALHIDDRLPRNRRYCRPWTAQFLAALAHAHDARFHAPLQLTSAVRTVAFQQHLQRINGNAAPADGDTASPHLTGQAVDLGKRGLSLTEIAWLRGYLLPLIEAGKIDVEEEFRQSCFHISVYRRYSPAEPTPPHYNVASRDITPALAATLP